MHTPRFSKTAVPTLDPTLLASRWPPADALSSLQRPWSHSKGSPQVSWQERHSGQDGEFAERLCSFGALTPTPSPQADGREVILSDDGQKLQMQSATGEAVPAGYGAGAQEKQKLA